MSPADLYIHAVIARHRAPAGDAAPAAILRQLQPLVRSWAGPYLESVTLSGSHPRSTALRDSDVDLFLSLAPDTPGPLSAMHASLAAHFSGFFPTPRNVSLRIQFQGAAVDLVPARRRSGSTFHTLWQLRRNTWLQTDVAEQIRRIRSSGLLNEILALKIWRRRRGLRFPSFLLELSVLRALAPNCSISEAFLRLLRFLAADFLTARIHDPANSNNLVSGLLSIEEKLRIAAAAEISLHARTWPEVFLDSV